MSLLIHNATLVLPDRVVPRGYILIDGDRIAEVGEGSPPHPLSPAPLHTIDATHKVVLPGLVNAHTHLEQTFMRGYSANRALLDWLKNYIWKLQAAMDVDDVRLATTLGLVEAMRGGATTILDHHKVPFSKRHTDVVLEAAEKLGVRLILARAWADRGTNAESPDAIVEDLSRLFAKWHGAADGRIHIANGPLVPWRCGAETLRRTTGLARRYNAITHCHMNETQDEVAITLRETGMRPVEWFDSLGILGPDFHAVHGVWLSDQEIKLLSKHGATVTHCPAANMILASGVAPITRLMRHAPSPSPSPMGRGIRLALGTDGPASNDGQDMFEMMRLAAYMQRVSTLDAQAMPPRAVIGMAAPSLTLPRGTGEGWVGAKADLVLLDFNAAHIQPVGDVLASIVYNARGSDVDTLIVDGRIIMRDKRFVDIDEMALLDECRDRARHLARRAGITQHEP
jgi:5-methylthioadenosine/S-adenosylhomocysteine deaminase